MAADKALALLDQAEALIKAARAELAPTPTPAPAATPAPTPVATPATAKPVGRVPENPTGTIAGLDYIYVEGDLRKIPDFTKAKATTTGATTHPNLSLPRREDGFAFRFTGFIYVPATEERTFYTASDDGSRLYIGNQVIVDNDAIQGTVEKSGKILLQKGWHAFTLDYFDFNGAQNLLVSWSSATQAKEPIPASAYCRIAPKSAPVQAKPEPKANVTNLTATLRNG